MYKLFGDEKKYFKIKYKKKRADPIGVYRSIRYSEEEDPPIGTVQGVTPDSVEEWRVALALDRLGIEYEFQKEVLGGKRVSGGSVVDFWLFTAPYPTPLYVDGTYWHKGMKSYDDINRRLELKKAFKGYINDIMTIDATQISSSKVAYYKLREMIFGY